MEAKTSITTGSEFANRHSLGGVRKRSSLGCGKEYSVASEAPKLAILYRMVMTGHLCPYGLKSKHLLHREGYRIEDHWLTTREQTDNF